MTTDESLDARVRRVDEDRWLATRFAPRDVRERLIAIYALNYEIARTAETVKAEGLGDIRLAWWREAIAEVHGGQAPRAHPVLQAYARHVEYFSAAAWNDMIDARAVDLSPAPFASWGEADTYLDRTAGGLMRMAIAASAAAQSYDVRAAALAWGYAGLLRSADFWSARGRTIFPGSGDEARARGQAAYDDVRRRPLPPDIFPALGYVALAPHYLRGRRGSLFRRQLALVWASATGRL